MNKGKRPRLPYIQEKKNKTQTNSERIKLLQHINNKYHSVSDFFFGRRKFTLSNIFLTFSSAIFWLIFGSAIWCGFFCFCVLNVKIYVQKSLFTHSFIEMDCTFCIFRLRKSLETHVKIFPFSRRLIYSG